VRIIETFFDRNLGGGLPLVGPEESNEMIKYLLSLYVDDAVFGDWVISVFMNEGEELVVRCLMHTERTLDVFRSIFG
jgi:hypothetical protein